MLDSVIVASASLGAIDTATKSFAEVSSILKPVCKFRRDLTEEVEAKKGIPFSKPSIKSLHANTMFPSAEAQLRDKVRRLLYICLL